MRRYLTECRISIASKLLENAVGTKRHMVQCVNMYSIADLIAIENGTLIEFLNKLFAIFEQHIRKCELCTGRGYLCEICSNNEVLFPFDDGAIHCKKCTTVFHRACWLRKNQNCPKCARVEHRRSLQLQTEEDEVNANHQTKWTVLYKSYLFFFTRTFRYLHINTQYITNYVQFRFKRNSKTNGLIWRVINHSCLHPAWI